MNEYLENLKSLYAEFKTNQTNLEEVEIIPNVQELLENRYFVNLFNGKETKYEQLCRRVSRVIAATEILHRNYKCHEYYDTYGVYDGFLYDDDDLLNQIRNIENSIYTDMINGNFLFNSPCLFSAGTGFSATENGHLLYDDKIELSDYEKIVKNISNKNQMLFACFVIGIEDSIEGIFDAVKKCAIISKAGGGVGLNFSPLREKNAKIRDNEGLASGVVSFAGDFNAMGDSIRQGGKRRVALMGMLNSNHPDIEEFINCKTEEGKLTNFNISVAIDDKFMEAIQNDSDYDLISSVDGHVVKTVKARELWNNICESAHRRGDPGIFFIDLANKDNILKNDEDYCIHGVNPCGEECLPDFTSCNLGSINLANFVTTNKEFDFDEFIKMVRRGIYYLDLVIDTSAYPLPEIEERTKAIRPVGLGIMGLADMFIKLGIKYGSEESNKLSEQIAQIMAAQSLYESVKLAEIKGSFEQFDKEPQQKLLLTMYNEMVINYGIESANNNIAIQYIKDIIDDNIKSILPISIANAFYSLYQYNKEDFYKIFHKFEDGYLRNSRRLTTAPTGTISMILNTSSSLEPNFAFEWKRNITNSNGTVETKIFKHKYADIENKELLVTANELTPDEHVNIVKAFAPYIDASISKTVNLSNNATVEDVKKVYENCYNNDIKGITIYRDMSREGQTLQKIDNNKPENKQDNKQDTSSIVNNIERPKVITGFTQKGETNYGNLYATLNVVDGKPYELFVNIGKSGSLAKSLSEALSRTISISLQNGINIDEIIKTLNGIADSETPWVFEDYKGNEEWCKSIPDMIAKMMKSLSEYVKEIGTVEQNINIKNTDNTANEQNIDMSSIIEHDKCSTDKKKILCPECLKNGNEIFLVQLAGCPTCPSCGWSACA